MKILLSAVLAAALCTPAFAQRMGSANRNAPMLKQSITAGDATMSLNYTSITWASGKTMTALADKENGARARKMVNDSAAQQPLADFSTSVDVMCGDLHLAAGDYKLYFTVDDECAWHLNFQGKGQDAAQSMKLDLQNSEHESKRLMMCLYAEETAGAGVYVAFGSSSGMLSFKPHEKKGD